MDDFCLTPPEPEEKDFSHADKINRAKAARNDEFYTRPQDIRDELSRYPAGTFAGKRIYCPMDGPGSMFPIVLQEMKARLGIRSIDHWWNDFKSYASIQRLDRSDIVITNPPFSLLREFLQWIIDGKKDYLIVAPVTAFTYPRVVESVKNGTMNIYNKGNKFDKFYVPESVETDMSDPDGMRIKIVRCVWLTSLYREGDDGDMIDPTARWDASKYRRYDNYDAIEVPDLASIPVGCPHTMGVPITYIGRHDADRYEIVGNVADCRIDGVIKFRRILIRERKVI